MRINTIREQLALKLTSIISYQQSAKLVADIRKKQLNDYAERESENPEVEPEILSSQRMYYKHPVSGEHTSFGFVKQNAQDQLLQVTLHENRQYQWLLSEAFEEYEKFLELAYLDACINDKHFWIQFKNPLSQQELDTKSDEWFELQLQTSKTRVSSEQILKQFRALLPSFKNLETKNALGVDLRFYLSLIAQIRHQSVHANGRVMNIQQFYEKTLRPIGLWNPGTQSNYTKIIDNLFFNPPYETTIALTRRPLKPDGFGYIYTDVMQDFCRLLVCSADLLELAITEHQGAAVGTSAATSCSSIPGLP